MNLRDSYLHNGSHTVKNIEFSINAANANSNAGRLVANITWALRKSDGTEDEKGEAVIPLLTNNLFVQVDSHKVLIGPSADSSTATPTFRTLTAGDIAQAGELSNTTAEAKHATSADSASQVTNSLTLKINTGTTEGTNKYTFNGSAARTLDIKPGTGISFTTAANTLTISNSSTNTDTTSKWSASTANENRYLGFVSVASPTSGSVYETHYSTGLKYNPSSSTLNIGGDLHVGSTIYGVASLDSITVSGSATFLSLITGSISGNAATSSKVNNHLVLKFDTGTSEGTSLYTFNGSAAKTINIKAGSNISLTKAANTITIDSSYTDTKNTAGSTDSTSKLFLIGAAGLGNNPQTYSSSKVYMTDGVITATSFSGALSGNATSADKVNNTLTIDGALWDGSSAKIVGNTSHYIVGPTSDTTAGTWTGTDTSITAYYDGLEITYVPAVAGASTTTLKLNNLNACTIYLFSNVKLTTHYPKNTPIKLIYKEGSWYNSVYDSGNTTLRTYYGLEGEYPILGAKTTNADATPITKPSTYGAAYGEVSTFDKPVTLNPQNGTITAAGGFIGNLTGLSDSSIVASNLTDGNSQTRFGILYQSAVSTTSSTNPGTNITGINYLGATTDNIGNIIPTWTSVDNTVTLSSTALITSGAVYSAINAGFAANDAMIFKGTYNASGVTTSTSVNTSKFSTAPTTTSLGWTWRVINSGYFGNLAVEAGDLIIANAENPGTTTTNYNIVQTNIDGAVTTSNANSASTIALFNGTKTITPMSITALGNTASGLLKCTTNASGNPSYSWDTTAYLSSVPAATTSAYGGFKLKTESSGTFTASANTNGAGSYEVKMDSNGYLYVDITLANTHYITHAYWAASATAVSKNPESATENTATYLLVLDNSTVRAALKITGSGAASVSANGDTLTISATNTTYNFAKLQYQTATGSATDFYTPGTTGTATNKILKAGDNISLSLSSNTLTVSATNTWKAANTSQEGYVPKLELNTTNTIAALASEYVLTYKSGTETTPVWRKLPANAFLNENTNTATAADNILDGSNSGTQITYAPYSALQSKLSFDVSTTNPTRTDRLNLNGSFYTTEITTTNDINILGEDLNICGGNLTDKVNLHYDKTNKCLKFIF